MNTQDFEAFREDLRLAATNFTVTLQSNPDADNYVNAIARLEVAAEKFAEAKGRMTCCVCGESKWNTTARVGDVTTTVFTCGHVVIQNARQPKPPGAGCEPESIS